ncbi:MAG: MBL fold metallo-hydrolase [Spirochaetes bacterium]|jgi:glyoxylase-like metal-dependent hydrolase (beta-lactamase superfamily II)|nr:MBL fold metallo-hydrolase [Spirochaetota bacterium]
MLKTYETGGVEIYRMGRSIAGIVPYWVHCFLAGDVLIDTGTRYAGKQFMESLSGKKISAIINTHHHEDHTGNNAKVIKKHGARAFAHHEAVPFIENPRLLNLRLYQRLVWGHPAGSEAAILGSVFNTGKFSFEPIYTPGHSTGHVSLFEKKQGWLFTGDIFCGIKNIYLRQDEDFNFSLNSIEALSELDVDVIFCSLKGPVKNGTASLKAKLDFMKTLRRDAERLKASGAGPVEIRKKLLGDEDRMFYLTAGHFSKQNLINSVLAGPGKPAG